MTKVKILWVLLLMLAIGCTQTEESPSNTSESQAAVQTEAAAEMPAVASNNASARPAAIADGEVRRINPRWQWFGERNRFTLVKKNILAGLRMFHQVLNHEIVFGGIGMLKVAD